MTLFPAIIVFVILFLSFSKKTLSQQEEDPRDRRFSKSTASDGLLDPNTALIKYELMKRGLEKKAQRGQLSEY